MAREHVEAVQFHVPFGTLDKIKGHAKKRGYSNLSAYIRHLIEDDVNDGLNLDVEHGGKRAKLDHDTTGKDE